MIALEGISARSGVFELNNISLRIPDAIYAVLMGPTGCGKTTLLEIVCGLRKPATGKVLINQRDVTREAPGNRGIGYVPQDGALFPTMTIRRHLAFAPQIHHWPRTKVTDRVTELADHLGIAHLLDRLPAGLSGGERQRVALGRALAVRPAALLLDEPLSALDPDLRSDLSNLLQRVQREEGISVLHVTHDRNEATRLGEMHLVLSSGGVMSAVGQT